MEGRATVKDEHTVHINGKDYTVSFCMPSTAVNHVTECEPLCADCTRDHTFVLQNRI